jgi:hypothetical protein
VKGRITAALAVAIMSVAQVGCGEGGKEYDISPIFPLTEDKCAQYDGDQEGSGVSATCMVTKDQCEQAASDWRSSMQSSGVNDAIQFSCE